MQNCQILRKKEVNIVEIDHIFSQHLYVYYTSDKIIWGRCDRKRLITTEVEEHNITKVIQVPT